MSFREWLAWKLRCWSDFIYDGEHRDFINVLSPDGKTALSIEVVGDKYACGIASMTNKVPEGWLVEWW